MSAPAGSDLTREQADALVSSAPFQRLLAVAAVIGVLVSLAAWCFLELVHVLQEEAFVHLTHALGYSDGAPTWWPVPVLAIVGALVAAAIVKLPGQGGHVPVHGLAASGPANPAELPGIVLAALASLGLGVVVGPEAPLIALGAGLAVYSLRVARRDVPPQTAQGVAATGSFAAISFIFGSPVVAAVILIEATGLGGHRLRLILLPGLLGARDRLARLARHGLAHRPQRRGLRAGGVAARAVRAPRRRRLRVGDPARRRHRDPR